MEKASSFAQSLCHSRATCSETVMNCWNHLPVDTVDFSSLAKFKRSIDAVKTRVFTGYSDT